MKLLAIIPLAVSAAANPLISSRQDTTAKITALSGSGTGCPSGSFSASLSRQGQDVTVAFDNYSSSVGNSRSGSNTRSCDLTLTITVPVGCTSMGLLVNYRGFASVADTVSGSFGAAYSISAGQLTSDSPPATFVGSAFASGSDYAKRDTVAAMVTARSGSEQSIRLTVRTTLSLSPASSAKAGLASADSADISIARQIRC
jgi:hypothetical protein